MSEYTQEFGKHVRSLRRARGMTQESLAQRCGLASDTIRRIEHGSMSAGIETIRKVCLGLGLSPATVFESFELGQNDERRELIDLISSRSPKYMRLVIRLVHVLLDELDRLGDD